MIEPSPPAVPSPAAGPSRAAPRKRRAQRWTDTAVVLLLGASLAAVLAAALPSLLRAAGLGAPSEETEWRGTDHLKLPTAPLGAPGNPIVAPGDDDDEGDEPLVTQLERDYPDGMWPGRRTPEDRERERKIFGERPGAGAPSTLKAGRTLAPLKLFKDPIAGAEIVAMVAANTPVQIVREVGDWVLIKFRGTGDPILGWVQKREISVR
ncbi:MAG: SH3 domain-containing protein [Byssovorax sp.]